MTRLDFPRPQGADVVAGASVALILIPQSLAYAELAGLPPYLGLFASAFPLLAFALFASSPFLQTGPTAVVSLLTFAALPTDRPEQLPQLAALLALSVGVMRLAIGALGAGSIVRLIALPVVTGFTVGAAILIMASQIPRVLGLAEGAGDGVLADAASALGGPGSWNLEALLLAVLTLALFLGGRRLHPLFPGVLLAVVAAIIWSRVRSFDGPVVADVPEGLPSLDLGLPWSEVSGLLLSAAVIALVGFAEPTSIARKFANETGQTWEPNREFMASGLANLVSGMTGGYPVGGSFSRSSINRFAGAVTRWAGGVTGVVVLLFLPFARVLEPLPRSVLAAIVLAAALSLIKPRQLLDLVRRNRVQAALAGAVTAATVISAPRIEVGVLIGVGLTVVAHFVFGLGVESELSGDTRTVRPTGLLWLGSERKFDQVLTDACQESAKTGCEVVLDFAAVPFVDDATIVSMTQAHKSLRAQGRRLQWINEPAGAANMLASLNAERER